ncbi:putative secreted protein/choice-of-anchor C domain-containing protein [Aliiruegeria haliotis]|uniref:Putative secreted protein/choice-of-anchor C domain-containing protein n=1 Tax=Aliiruegeria haliotis TaxID=1280846 RepID=A0A2T0RNC8_9RHOB|nr:DUF642 domain-containing protein [Aliiruegeria haliotis]PRY22689.1 putative secreted protein/choice-of-anchor C domain-containing protein [Aliiruegeria haliotis]
MKRLLLACVLCSLGAGVASAATITNGSFEAEDISPDSWRILGAGSPGLPGWIIGGDGVDVKHSAYYPASDGNQSIDLVASSGSGDIRQVVNGLSVGSTYRISFDYAANPAVRRGVVIRFAASIGNFRDAITVGTNTLTRGVVNWTPASFDFTAGNTSERLRFASRASGSASGAMIDNVSISLVPVPAAGILLLAGLGGLAAMRRRKS